MRVRTRARASAGRGEKTHTSRPGRERVWHPSLVGCRCLPTQTEGLDQWAQRNHKSKEDILDQRNCWHSSLCTQIRSASCSLWLQTRDRPNLNPAGAQFFRVWPPPSIPGGVGVVVLSWLLLVWTLLDPAPDHPTPDPLRRTSQNFALLFPSPATISFFFCLSGNLLVEFWWCLKRAGREMCKIRWSCPGWFWRSVGFPLQCLQPQLSIAKGILASVSWTINCARLTSSRNAPTRFFFFFFRDETDDKSTPQLTTSGGNHTTHPCRMERS